jgi:hypothetical protein
MQFKQAIKHEKLVYCHSMVNEVVDTLLKKFSET